MAEPAPAEPESGETNPQLPATIATTPASRPTRLLAAGIAVLLVAVSGLVLPVARTGGPEIPAFLPIFSSGVVIGDLLTAYLLFNQARLVGLTPLAVLAAGYLFTGSIAAVQLMVFPGVFSAGGLLGAGPQTAVWLWMVWHGGFAVYVLAYAGLTRRRSAPGGAVRRGLAPGTLLLVVLLATLATAGHDLLPSLVADGDYRRSFAVGAAPLVLAANAAAVVLLPALTRLRTIVQTWLFIAILASFLDALVTLIAGARFSVGWYVARVDSLFAAAVILIALQHEMIRLYGEVVALNRRLAQLAVIDGLTGMANRRRFDQALAEEWRRCARQRRPLSLLLADVDFFKRYNDALGHPAGDACLKAVAGAIARSVQRPGDLAARYGGEEFVVLAPGGDAAGAAELASRVRARIHDLALVHPAGAREIVTVSIGIATAEPWRDGTAAATLAAADQALYAAKQAGRDRAVAAPGPAARPASGRLSA
jgi:diguanylate cyclase (GGDEF)-like protein